MIDFGQRLKRLKDRRQGTRERAILDHFDENAARQYLQNPYFDYRLTESYESLQEANGVKYAIGAMAPDTVLLKQLPSRQCVFVRGDGDFRLS